MHFWRPYWWRLFHGLLSVTKVSQVWLNVSHSWILVQGAHSVCFLQSLVMVLGGSMVVKKGTLSLLGSWFQLLDLILFIKSVPLRKCYLFHLVCEPNILDFVEACAWALQLDQSAACFCLWLLCLPQNQIVPVNVSQERESIPILSGYLVVSKEKRLFFFPLYSLKHVRERRLSDSGSRSTLFLPW